MRYKSYRLFLSVLVLFVITGNSVFSQALTDPEQEYARIRSLAFEEKYTEAEPAARNLVKQYPEYGDARVLLGRIIAWQGRYDEGAAVIDTLLTVDPDNSDALEAIRDIKRWSHDRSQQRTVPTDIRAGYLFDTYSEPYERLWQVFSVGSGHRFSWGSVVGTLNAGHINIGDPSYLQDNDIQFCAEAWPELTKSNYAYIAYAYSPGSWFPRHRAALEVWQTLPAALAMSAGVNYYYFDDNVFIGTVSLEKYLKNYWFSARTYFYFKDIGVTTSFYINVRRYFKTTDYLQLTLGTGTAPDEPFDIITDLDRQQASSIRLTWFDQLNKFWSYRIGAGYSYEKYDASDYRNRFEGTVTIIRGIGKAK